MAKIELDYDVRIVLTKKEIQEMQDALFGTVDHWIRLCITNVDVPEMTVYLQGPNGEEQTVLAACNQG